STLEDAVIKDQIDKKVLAANGDAPLPGLETKSAAHFMQERLKFIQQRAFQAGFTHDVFRLQPEEFKDIGIADC
ncbi:MAG: hypothetical protein PVI94_05255, partial [Desulfobacterales bacterium]